jgi:aryl-alcohol dehydrogenase-like predicted oxidoreductase
MNNRQMNRRNFLRMTAVAGAALIPVESRATAAVKSVAGGQPSATDIAVRTLGRTGLQMPILSMGVMRADNPSVLRAAYNSGIRHFDTAHGYQNGKNEEMVGTFFADKPRDSIIIATKVKFDYPLKDDFEEKFEADVETSLKRLKMSYVDLFYIHAITGVEPITDARVLAAVKKVKESGKARFIGVSTHDGNNNIKQIDAVVELGIYDVILTSYNFKLNNLDALNAAIERATKAGIGFVAMKTMTGGVTDAEGKKKIDAKACLKWVWQNENFTTIIPGFTNYDELEECVAAVESPEINENEKKYLAELRDCEMLYCQQCGKCLSQCPERLPIPDIMRAYMYSFGYKLSSMSKETLAELNLPEDVCASCKGSSCKVNCQSGFRVGDKIAAVMPVRNVPDIFLS